MFTPSVKGAISNKRSLVLGVSSVEMLLLSATGAFTPHKG